MSLFRKLILIVRAKGAGSLESRIAAIISSVYNLCSSVPFEELTVQPSSTYFLCIEQKEFLTVSPTSEYSLTVENGGNGEEKSGFQTRHVNNVIESEWTDPENAFLENGLCTFTKTDVAPSYYNFINNPFTIPAGVTINGLYVLLRWGGDGDDRLHMWLTDASGSNRLKGGAVALAGCADAKLAAAGGEDDLWGGTWTPDHINSANFVLWFRYAKTAKANFLYIDFLKVTVYFSK